MQLRESLEDQVMAMAEAAKKLFEENLYYSNGDHVKVVMADTSIGRVPGICCLRRKSSSARALPSRCPSPLLVLRRRDDGHGPP